MSRRGSGSKWALVRLAVFRRDGYRCTACGNPGELEAAHLTALRDGGDNSLENVRTLCRTCHVAETREQRGLGPKYNEGWQEAIEEMRR